MLRGVMATARQGGLTVMRSWTDGVSPEFALQTAPGVYNEAIFRGLDYVLDQARQQGIRVRSQPGSLVMACAGAAEAWQRYLPCMPLPACEARRMLAGREAAARLGVHDSSCCWCLACDAVVQTWPC